MTRSEYDKKSLRPFLLVPEPEAKEADWHTAASRWANSTYPVPESPPAHPESPTAWTGRHPSVQHFERLFGYLHLAEHMQRISQPFAALAERLLDDLNDGPELTVALRKLVEAKDCAVRQAMIDYIPPGE